MKLLKCALVLLAISGSSLVSAIGADNEEVISIDSELASYNGEQIVLQGNVVVEHALGTITANHVTLFPSKKKEIGPFGLVLMQDRVNFALKGGEVLSCGKAEFDCQALSGVFSSNESQEFVTYRDRFEKKGASATAETSTPITVKSQTMAIQLAPGEIRSEKKLAINNVNVLTADGSVTVNYNNDFVAVSDHAVYQRRPEGIEAGKLTGIITMNAANEGICQVSNREGDIIKAVKIEIDPLNRQLTFTSPVGTLNRHHPEDPSGGVDFSARSLTWNDQEGILKLRGQVKVDQEGVSKLETPHEVQILQSMVNQKRALKSIESAADTILTYVQDNKHLCHTLTCSGPVKVNHEKMETRLYAKHDDANIVSEEDQVHFEDAKGEVFADKVLIKYRVSNGSLVVDNIYLVGNVKIYNRLNSADDETIVVLQYVLADRVDFKPHTNEMLFKSSKGGRRVLFFDKVNNLQVSAPALKIIRDKATMKDSIKGEGDVRFSFLESEFEQLRKRFSLYVDTSKNEKAPQQLIGDL